MKRLMKVKLINWHRFLNETIEIGDSVLLSGENGAGKSTLLDALQFVITASKNNFNKAAHENGKRKLAGYVRCKTGVENKPYERTGQITCHVALEFYDEAKKTPFVLGTVVDSLSEDSETCVWYRMEKERIKDEYFIEKGRPRNINNFRSYHQNRLSMIEKTQRAVRKDYKSRFGRLEDKFFELIPKSLAFKPIDDIKDFVYSYVLDQKEVNIDVLRENVRTFKELEVLLDTTRNKIEMLEEVCSAHDKVMDCQEKDSFYEYFLAKIDVEISLEDEKKLRKQSDRAALQVEQLKKKISALEEQKQDKTELAQNLFAELRNNENYQLKDQLNREIEKITHEIVQCTEEVSKLQKSIDQALLKAAGLMEIGPDMLKEPAGNFTRFFSVMDEGTDFTQGYEANTALIEAKKEAKRSNGDSLYQRRTEQKQLAEEIEEVNLCIERLSEKKLQYDRNVEELKSAIERELANLGRAGEVRILCQLLSVNDESWRNAIEGYLNKQKFYLLVDPEDFDLAVSVYDRLRKKKRIYGAGIINTRGLERFDEVDAASLAAKVDSENLYARRYINMVMGKLIMCDRPEELKQHNRAITRECMRYQNRVASVLNPKTYETPYIGQEAIRMQLETAKAKRQELLSCQEKLSKEIAHLIEIERLLGASEEIDINYNLRYMEQLRNLRTRKEKLQENLEKVSGDPTYLMKEQQYEQVTREVQEVETQISKETEYKGQQQGLLLDMQQELFDLLEGRKALDRIVSEIEEKLGDGKLALEGKFTSLLGSRPNRELKNIYEQTQKGNLTKMAGFQEEMIHAMFRYKSAHEMGAPASMEGYLEFEGHYHYLRDSKLLSYESKVTSAKEAAETEFREQFLSKLQENIKQAKAEFARLNKALEAIPFGSDYYKFEYFGSRQHREYYDMIMDDFNIIDGMSLLSGQFHEKHRAVIDELFDKLTLDDNSGKTLDEFTDYRTYMDYDIRIDHGDGKYSYYSKVCEEKSGGETQTPFYVTVAASFMQLYSSAIGGDSIGLILLDEAFNNMDDERIAGVLEFYKKMPLQVIVAAPPDKIQYIQPSINHTLLVLKDENISYVEKFDYERV